MSQIKKKAAFRVKLGISQPDMAHYLGVTRSQIAMYEQGSRSLPAEAMVKLGEMLIMHEALKQSKNEQTAQPVLHTHIQKHHKTVKEKVKSQVENCRHRLKAIQMNIDNMNKEYEKAETWWHLLNKMMENIPAGKNKKGDQLWLEIQHTQTLQKMTRQGIASQAKLQAASELLSAELMACKSILSKL